MRTHCGIEPCAVIVMDTVDLIDIVIGILDVMIAGAVEVI